MISIEHIKNFYPSTISGNAIFLKYILKEYLQPLALDYLSKTHHIRKMTFIGGANLRLTKGRDYYDTMFLLSQTKPDYSFLTARCGIRNLPELKEDVATSLHSIDLNHKQRDFEHLLSNRLNCGSPQY